MTRLTARVQKVRDELEQLLDDDDDMADLYLSRKLFSASSASTSPNYYLTSPTIGSKISRASRASLATVRGDENDVEELEMLLEAYFMQIDSTLNRLTTVISLLLHVSFLILYKLLFQLSTFWFLMQLREYIDDTEDYINIQLDNHRNQLIQVNECWIFLWSIMSFSSWSSFKTLQLELVLSSGTVCSSFYSLVAGIFGMNIPYTWNNDHGYMFKYVCNQVLDFLLDKDTLINKSQD